MTNNKYFIFGEGGARKYAESAGVPFLGDIPLVQAIMEGGECGTPTVATDSQVEKYYRDIAEKIVATI